MPQPNATGGCRWLCCGLLCKCVLCLQDYLRDTHHPADWFLNNVLNIYLNLFRDHENAAELD